MRVSPDTAVVILDAPAILIVSFEFNVVPVESSPTTVIVELVRYELRLGPVMVSVDPATDVVIPVAPTTDNVLSRSIDTTVEPSSATLRVLVEVICASTYALILC